MNPLESIDRCFKKYLASTPSGSYIHDHNISFITSGSSGREMNYCIIYKISNLEYQKKLFKEHFDVNGVVLSFPASRMIVKNIGENLSYAGRVGVMVKQGYRNNAVVNSFRVDRLNQQNKDDFIDFVHSQRGTEPSTLGSIVDACGDDLYVYMAYDEDEVIGMGSAIKDGRSVMIIDTIVKDESRNEGALTAIGMASMSDVSKRGNFDYIAIVSSEYSAKVAQKIGYEVVMTLDMWMNRGGE